ncbi:helix-turn-helix transcriptional regulator [Microcoleus sp. F8-D3]
MIPLEYVARLLWSQELGERLKGFRGKTSRRELAEKLKTTGQDCSHQNLQKIEDGNAQTVPVELVLAICKVLGISLGQLIPMAHLEYPAEKSTTIG